MGGGLKFLEPRRQPPLPSELLGGQLNVGGAVLFFVGAGLCCLLFSVACFGGGGASRELASASVAAMPLNFSTAAAATVIGSRSVEHFLKLPEEFWF